MQKRTRQGQLSWQSRCLWCLICESTIAAARVPPTITAPATIPTFFIRFLLKNSALSGGVSGDGKGEGGDPSDVEWCDGADPSGVGLCKSTRPPDIGSSESIDPSDAEKWCKGVNPCGGELVSVGAKSDTIRCGDAGISEGPEVPELEG